MLRTVSCPSGYLRLPQSMCGHSALLFWFFAGENYRTKLRGMKLSTINNSWRCYLCLNGYVMGFAGLLDMLSIAMDKKLTTKSPSSNRHMI